MPGDLTASLAYKLRTVIEPKKPQTLHLATAKGGLLISHAICTVTQPSYFLVREVCDLAFPQTLWFTPSPPRGPTVKGEGVACLQSWNLKWER